MFRSNSDVAFADTLLLVRAASLAVCVILIAGSGRAQDRVFPQATVSTADEIHAADIDTPGVDSPRPQSPRFFSNMELDEERPDLVLMAFDGEVYRPTSIAQVLQSPVPSPLPEAAPDLTRFQGSFSSGTGRFGIGLDLYSPPEFEGGLIVYGKDVAMKIGGYVKADFIYDFDPIDSTDSFDTTEIEVGAPHRTNTRFHARQTRMSMDTRWVAYEKPIRIFVEGDFFGSGNSYRLRHAYGEVGSLLVGQTWTTFTDVAAAPATLDFEGSVSNVNRRQAMVRWTQAVFHEDLTLALAAEDAQFIVIPPVGITGFARSPSPDLVARLRLSRDRMRFQVAGLYRLGGFQPTGERVVTRSAWGLNFTGTVLLTERTKLYSQIVIGEGIGSYRSLPDAAPESATTDNLLGLTGWMVGVTREWTEQLTSNFTYAENSLDNTLLQEPDDVHKTTYLAANLIWSPVDRVKVGIEYLYGLRENIDREVGDAHRIQAAFILDLP